MSKYYAIECTAMARRVGSCVVCVLGCGCVVSSCPAVKELWWSKYWEPINLIPVRLIPACLQRGSDYQKGEALVADTAGLSASEPVSGQTMDLDTLWNVGRWFCLFHSQ